MYSELVKRIQELLAKQEVVIVAISGHGGSGKSTLAEALAKKFDIDDEQIICVDMFHAQNYMDAKNIYKQHEWQDLITLLTSARSNRQLHYLSRDWRGDEHEVSFTRPKLIIVEGIRLIRPELLPQFDLSVWIDCPLELAAKRAIDRNLQQGDSQKEIELWHTKWIPEAKQYQDQIQPKKIADFIYIDTAPPPNA
jgi:uridine kinase